MTMSTATSSWYRAPRRCESCHLLSKWPIQVLAILDRICSLWHSCENQRDWFDAPSVLPVSWSALASRWPSLPTPKLFGQTNMWPKQCQTLDAPTINATPSQNALSNLPTPSIDLYRFDPKSMNDIEKWNGFSLDWDACWEVVISMTHFNCLVTWTCCNSLAIIIVQNVMDDVLVLRSYFLWFKHFL